MPRQSARSLWTEGRCQQPAKWSQRSGIPSVASGRKDSCRNPPPEDEEGEANQDEGAELEIISMFPLFVGFDFGLLAGSQDRGVSNWSSVFFFGVDRRRRV
jgi:hypothetical protein